MSKRRSEEHEDADLGEYATRDLVRSFRAGGITAHAFRQEMLRRGATVTAKRELARALRENPGSKIERTRAVLVADEYHAPARTAQRRRPRGRPRKTGKSLDEARVWDQLEAAARVLEGTATRDKARAIDQLYRAVTWLRVHAKKAPRALASLQHTAGFFVVAASNHAGMRKAWPTPWAKPKLQNLGANVLRFLETVPRPRVNPAPAAHMKRARLAYRVTHWGHGGKGGGRRLPFADPTGPIAEIGELMFAGYRTTKAGDGPGPNIYVHDFGPKDRPRLAFNVESKRLLIGGGKARMLTRGITG